ncbi:hypothetical protein FHR32_002172 [Streptosporangium album]|uniref:Uncharacterized protein n=1 Tax=Streptosporangium album TaxID=47479 RepID=A0A7W7RTY3_9ACTN|nr:hypothetical protein [Streptosporangium album]
MINYLWLKLATRATLRHFAACPDRGISGYIAQLSSHRVTLRLLARTRVEGSHVGVAAGRALVRGGGHPPRAPAPAAPASAPGDAGHCRSPVRAPARASRPHPPRARGPGNRSRRPSPRPARRAAGTVPHRRPSAIATSPSGTSQPAPVLTNLLTVSPTGLISLLTVSEIVKAAVPTPTPARTIFFAAPTPTPATTVFFMAPTLGTEGGVDSRQELLVDGHASPDTQPRNLLVGGQHLPCPMATGLGRNCPREEPGQGPSGTTGHSLAIAGRPAGR